MKVLAVDYGSKSVGLASGDLNSGIAFPKSVMKRNPGEEGDKKLIEDLLKICREEGYKIVVFGLPLEMDDKDGAGRKSNQYFFVEKLMKNLESTAKESGIDIKVCGIDERLSSFEADSYLSNMGLSGAKLSGREKGDRDMLAAKVILERYFKEKFD